VTRVFVVDDSSFVRKALVRVLGSVPGVNVVGEAGSGGEALDKLAAARPDVVTLDVEMPGLGGLDTLRGMLAQRPDLTVIMLSAHTRSGAAVTLDALALGAVDFIDKRRLNVVDFDRLRRELVGKLDSLRERQRVSTPVPATRPPGLGLRLADFDLCVIGASTGGPPAVQAVLGALPADFPLPVVVVQHMPVGFTAPFAQRLAQVVAVPVSEAVHGQRLSAGAAVIAPAGRHLRMNADLVVELDDDEAGASHVPSVDVAMLAAVKARGPRVLGILLTGMGSDGAAGLLAIRAAGGTTIGESEASCVVYGMPRAAMERGAVVHQLGLGQIAALLAGAASRTPR
jgi:two-component system chemotaxis response regulator CheB